MDRNKVKQEIIRFFHSEQWARLQEVLIIKDNYHVHIHVDTQVHPMCLEQLIKSYYEKKGNSIKRKIEIFTSGNVAGAGTVHGIEVPGCPHFDFLFQYSDKTVLGPTDMKGEPNVQYWDKVFMDDFHAKFPFKTSVTLDEQKEIDAYFESQAWRDYCRLNLDDQVVHIHANVETSMHPYIIRENALKAMKKEGWEIAVSVPVAYTMRGGWNGKIVFAGLTPEKMFDIAWVYNPLVTLVPATRYSLQTESPTYDARTMNEIPLLLKKNNYILLSLAEMEEITKAM